MNQRQLLDKLKKQALKLADSECDYDKREGFGMLRVIDAVENLPDHEGGHPPGRDDMFVAFEPDIFKHDKIK